MADIQDRAVDALMESARQMGRVAEKLESLSALPRHVTEEHEATRALVARGQSWQVKALVALVALALIGAFALVGVKLSMPTVRAEPAAVTETVTP